MTYMDPRPEGLNTEKAPESIVETLRTPDLNTVTFDASQYQLVPKVPTEEILYAIFCNEHDANRAWGEALAAAPTPVAQDAFPPLTVAERVALDNYRAKEFAQSAGNEEGKPLAPVENVTELELHSTEANATGADAAPPAQSAGQLAFAWATHHDEPMLFLDREEAALYCEDDEQPIPLYAAPVNASEPVAWRYRESKEEKWGFTRHHPRNFVRMPKFVEPLYAAPVNGGERAEYGGNHVENHCPECNERESECSCAADVPPVDVNIAKKRDDDPTHEMLRQIARDVRNAAGGPSDAPQPFDYVLGGWRAACTAVSSPAKVGGDAVSASNWWAREGHRTVWPHGDSRGWEGAATHGYAAGLAAARAALSADAGEDKRDAERYRVIRNRPTTVMKYGGYLSGEALDIHCDAIAAKAKGEAE